MAVSLTVVLGVAVIVDRMRNPLRYDWTSDRREVWRRLAWLAVVLGAGALVGVLSGAPAVAGAAGALWLGAAGFCFWLT